MRDFEVAGRPARLYMPTTAGGRPLLVFFHGGGWVYGDLDSHDAVCRFLAERAGVRVLAIDYRLAPGAPLPRGVRRRAGGVPLGWSSTPPSLGADPDRLAVGGDSAGGCLAATTAIEAAREGLPLRLPAAGLPGHRPAPRHRGAGRPVRRGLLPDQRFMDLATESYLDDPADPPTRGSPRCTPTCRAGLAPAYVVTAGFDPLRDEGEAYARKLADAGVEVELRRFPDQIHGFFNIVGVGRTSRAAVAEIATRLRAGLA